jgi:multidrug resistance efflux pump
LYFALALASVCFVPQSLHAEVVVASLEDEIAGARRELAAAKIEARQYWQVEYSSQLRALNAEIELADAEIRALRREIRRYIPNFKYSYGQLPTIAYRDLPLCLQEAEIRQRTLIGERNDLIRYRANHQQLLELRVAAARDRLIALEGGGLIEFEPGIVVEPARPVE